MSLLAALFVFLTACLVAILATPPTRRLHSALGWRDRPEAHKVHHAARPTAGGSAVALALVLSLLTLRLSFAEVPVGLFHWLLAVAPGAAIVFGIGLLDDVRGCRPVEKLLAQCVALAVVQARIDLLGFGGPEGSVVLGAASALAVLLVTNSMNLIDGIDGLASSLAVVGATGLGVLGLLLRDPLTVVVAAALAGALTGFLRLNRPPARIFLGDSGSMGIGLVLGVLALRLWQLRPTALTALALVFVLWVPLLDTTLAVLRRTVSGVSIFRPDRDHLHHRMLRSGYSRRGTLNRLVALAVLCAGAGVALVAGARPAVVTLVAVAVSMPLLRMTLPVRVQAALEQGDETPVAPAAVSQGRAA